MCVSYDKYTEHNSGHEVAVEPGGAGPVSGWAAAVFVVGGGGGGWGRGWSRPELLGEHAARAVERGAVEDRSFRERVAST